jgi:hypothetical protein
VKAAALLVLSTVLSAALASAQSVSPPGNTSADPTRTVRMAGFLTNAVTGEPVRRATVVLQFLSGVRPGQATQTTLADAAGHFEFEGLVPGLYHVSTERRGYPKQNVSPADGIVINDDRTDLSFRMEPYAALTGKVTDENGDAIAGAAIQLIRSEIQSGRRELRPALSTVTDDRGEYRVAALPSGRYYVSAYARAQELSDTQIYPRRFFPGSLELTTASALELEAGANQHADFQLTPETAFHIRGKVSDSRELSGLSIVLSPRNAAERFGSAGYQVSFTGEGNFDIAGVGPGQYLLTVSGNHGNALLNASQPVSVGAADQDGLSIVPHAAVSLTGRLTVEGNPLPTNIAATISLFPSDTITRPILFARASANQAFTMPNVLPGDYTLQAVVPAPYYLKSATVGGMDALSGPLTVPDTGGTAPLEIVLGSLGGEVSGTVKMQDRPAAGCIVLLTKPGGLVPSQDKFAQTDANGKFLIGQAAPGDYVLYAFRDLAGVEYRNPQVLSQFSGTSVKVAEGGKQSVDLQLNVN